MSTFVASSHTALFAALPVIRVDGYLLALAGMIVATTAATTTVLYALAAGMGAV